MEQQLNIKEQKKLGKSVGISFYDASKGRLRGFLSEKLQDNEQSNKSIFDHAADRGQDEQRKGKQGEAVVSSLGDQLLQEQQKEEAWSSFSSQSGINIQLQKENYEEKEVISDKPEGMKECRLFNQNCTIQNAELIMLEDDNPESDDHLRMRFQQQYQAEDYLQQSDTKRDVNAIEEELPIVETETKEGMTCTPNFIEIHNHVYSNQLKLNCQIVHEDRYQHQHKNTRDGNRSSSQNYSDRFIPNRIPSHLYELKSAASDETQNEGETDKVLVSSLSRHNQKRKVQVYSDLLKNSILSSENELFGLRENNFTPSMNINHSKKLLRYSQKKEMTAFLSKNNQACLNERQPESFRRVNDHPFKVLEANKLQDDFYLNLLDWSPLNCLVVGLLDQVVLWSGCSSTTSTLCRLENAEVTSVACSQRSNHIAVGDSNGNILIYDLAHRLKPFLTIKGHLSRIGSIAWNSSIIASGSRDRSILVRDLRQPLVPIQHFAGHKQEICGLKWSYNENILASGGNDNKLFLWTLQSKTELAKFSEHGAAVKALGFSPHQHNLLASGGGTADRCIRFWNTQTLKQIDCLDTGSQVCNLMFSRNVNEIVSTHGYSLNQIILWKYPSMKKIKTLTGHTQRVLYLAMSPCGQNIVTGAGDETLRFWNLFPSLQNKSNILATNYLLPSCMDLR